MRTFSVALFFEGGRVALLVKAAHQGEATSKVLEMYSQIPMGFTMICKEVKA